MSRTLLDGVYNRKLSITAVGTAAAARYMTAGLIVGSLLLLLL